MSELVEKVASRLARTPLEQCDDEFRNTPFWGMCEADARLAIAAVAEFLCLEAARSASPAQAHEYLSATFLKKQLEQPK